MRSELIDAEQACKMLRISRRTLYRHLKAGGLRGVKVGRTWRFESDTLHDLVLGGETPNQDALGNYHLLRGEGSRVFDRIYGHTCRAFVVSEVSRINPDLIVVEDREASRLFQILDLLPKDALSKVVVISALKHRAKAVVDMRLANSSVLLLDEVAERARSLSRQREFLESHSARVHTTVLAVRKTQYHNSRIEDLELRAAMELSDGEYRKFTALLSRVMLESGARLDVDHLTITFRATIDLVEKIKTLCCQVGQYYPTSHFLAGPSDDGWTMDDPQFIRFPRRVLRNVSFDGVCKFRFSYDKTAQLLHVAVIMAPSISVFPNRPAQTPLGVLGRKMADILPSDYRSMEPAWQAKYLYEASLLVICAEGARQFLQVLDEEKIVSGSSLRCELNKADVFSCFDPKLDGTLVSLVEQIVHGAPLDPEAEVPRYLLPDFCGDRPVYCRNRIADADPLPGFIGLQRIGDTVIKTIKDEIVAMQKASFAPLAHAVDLPAIYARSCASGHMLDYSRLSLALDVLLDLALLKPRNRVLAIGIGHYQCSRGYLLSERSGVKEAPESRDGFVESKSETAKHRIFIRSRVLIEHTIRYLSQISARPEGFPEYLFAKVFANLELDWEATDEPFPLDILRYRYGGFVRIPQPISSPNEYVSLIRLAERSKLLQYDKKTHYVSYLPQKEHDDLLDAQLAECLSFAERIQVEALLRGYRKVLQDLDRDDFDRPNSFLAMSVARTPEEAYGYLHVETGIWTDDVHSALGDLKVAARLRETHSEILAESFFLHMRNADIAPSEIARKMRMASDQASLLKRLSQSEFPDPAVKQHILSRFRSIQPESLQGDSPFARFRALKTVLGLSNTILVGSFACITGIGSGSDKVTTAGRALARMVPATGPFVDTLVAAIGSAMYEDAAKCVGELIETIETKVIGLLPIPAVISLNPVEQMRMLMAETNTSLHQTMAAVGQRQFAIAFVDILGFLAAADRLVREGRFSGTDDASKHLRQQVDTCLQDHYNIHKKLFFTVPLPVGGDGWLLIFEKATGCYDFVRSLIHQLRENRVEQLPMAGLSWGKPLVHVGGAVDRASIMAYLLTEHHSRYKRQPGLIVATETFLTAIQEEDVSVATEFRQCGLRDGYNFPGHAGRKIKIFAARG